MTHAPFEEPFPGARPQVRGPHAEPTRPPAESVFGPGTLPLEARPARVDGGWLIRLPVRAEEVTVRKTTFVRERVLVRRRVTGDVEQIREVVRRERPRVEVEDLDTRSRS